MEKAEELGPVKLTAKQNVWQVFKFILFSSSAGLIEAVSFALLNELSGMPYWPSYLIALVLSVLWNFTFNRRFTFKSATNVPIAMLKVAGFYAVFTPLSTWAGNTLELRGINEYLILLTTMVFNLILEYFFCRFVVYRNSINTNDIAKKQMEKVRESGSEVK
jgi:putative flippase GtrA